MLAGKELESILCGEAKAVKTSKRNRTVLKNFTRTRYVRVCLG